MQIPAAVNLLGLAVVVGAATFVVAKLDPKIVPNLDPKIAPNLATGAVVTISSRESGSPDPAHVIDGDASRFGFHTQWEQSPWVLLDLHSEKLVRHITVYNRLDCCRERAVPLVIALSRDGQNFTEVARADEPFDRWNAVFAPQNARFIRAESLRPGFLHLNEIEVH
jgi:hypothetical protein